MPTDRSNRSSSRPPPPPPPPVSKPMLRLHRDEADTSSADAQIYKFPTARAAPGERWTSRKRLVAAKVSEMPLEHTFDGNPCGVLNGGDDPDCIGRIVTSNQLVREIEETLDRMQGRLSDFRGEIDRAFKFPRDDGDDRDLPPAA
jgi:hypothetical protein